MENHYLLYKVFALSLVKRLSPIMHQIILPEQKGFIKGRFILDAIITLWKYAQDSDQEFKHLILVEETQRELSFARKRVSLRHCKVGIHLSHLKECLVRDYLTLLKKWKFHLHQPHDKDPKPKKYH